MTLSDVQVGDRVRLVALHGVASASMRDQLDHVGTVTGAHERGGVILVDARFPNPVGGDEVFRLRPGEWALVERVQPAADSDDLSDATDKPEPAPEHAPEEASPVADFATAVQRRIDQLTEEDAALEAQARDLATRRAAVAQERKALTAGVAAYLRVVQPPGPKALAAPTSERAPRTNRDQPAGAARTFLLEWAEAHGGTVERSQALTAAVLRGLSANQVSGLLLAPPYERVERGVYRLRERQAS